VINDACSLYALDSLCVYNNNLKEKLMERKPPSKTNYRKIAMLSSMGLMLPSSTAIGMLFGYLLDKLFKSQPWLLILFTLLGVASAILGIMRGLNKIKDD